MENLLSHEAFLTLVGVAVVIFAWNCSDWIEAKANESKERTRKAKLENDKLELEVSALRSKKGQ